MIAALVYCYQLTIAEIEVPAPSCHLAILPDNGGVEIPAGYGIFYHHFLSFITS